jgi:hypothetical protein
LGGIFFREDTKISIAAKAFSGLAFRKGQR